MSFAFFDPTQDVYIHYGRLPHWEQPGATYFIAWRTADSIPEAVRQRFRVERAVWLRKQGIDPQGEDWRELLRGLPRSARLDYHQRFTAAWMDCLDQCHGECVLRRGPLAGIVDENLRHLDGNAYVLAAFVVMPNHVHVLVQLPTAGELKRRCKAWKHYTAARINRELGREGEFWQHESFDQLVRSEEQFRYLCEYIARNPVVAGLAPGEFRQYERSDAK